MSTLKERSAQRRQHMVTNRASTPEEAEVWDLDFDEAWNRRIEAHYGEAPANWIDLDSLIAIKSAIDHPRHREDARVLKLVKARTQND